MDFATHTAAFGSPPGNPEGEKMRQMQIMLAVGIGMLLGALPFAMILITHPCYK